MGSIQHHADIAIGVLILLPVQTHPDGFAFFSFNSPGGTIRLGLSSFIFRRPT